jgi:hypothetical protein
MYLAFELTTKVLDTTLERFDRLQELIGLVLLTDQRQGDHAE